jgi:hypothetical protein
MGASHSVEPDVPVLDTEAPEPDVEPDDSEYDPDPDDIQWLWPFI